MRELVIISGKGGTGKTSLTACFAYLASKKVLADCDVDAADLHILVNPVIQSQEDFVGGVKASIISEKCVQCGACREVCRYGAISEDFEVSPIACEGCGVCFYVCPEDAVCLKEGVNGRWFISETRFGPMVHATLFPGEENSGKLVALVRNQAKVLARQRGASLILVDGAPGVGCPVISSVTGANYVLVVTEPSMSGIHDMDRAVELVKGFDIPILVVMNKFDVNLELSRKLEQTCTEKNIQFLGNIPYDERVIESMVQRRCVVELDNGPANRAIRDIWQRLQSVLLN